MKKILMFLPSNIRELSLYSYEKFKKEGLGFVYIEPKEKNEQDFNYSYVSGDEAISVASEQLKLYNPEDEFVFVISQPDNSLSASIQKFTDKTGTPKYLYDLKHHPILGTPQD